jgi:hypothetical protein
LNSMLCERCCLAMAFIFRKPRTPCQITNFNLSGSRGALHRHVRSVPIVLKNSGVEAEGVR